MGRWTWPQLEWNETGIDCGAVLSSHNNSLDERGVVASVAWTWFRAGKTRWSRGVGRPGHLSRPCPNQSTRQRLVYSQSLASLRWFYGTSFRGYFVRRTELGHGFVCYSDPASCSVQIAEYSAPESSQSDVACWSIIWPFDHEPSEVSNDRVRTSDVGWSSCTVLVVPSC